MLAALLAACGDDGGSAGGDDANPAGEPDAAPVGPTRPEGVALCYTELSEQHAATAAFRTALAGGRLEDRDEAIADLTAAAMEFPDEEQFALLLGLAHLWRLAEPLPEEVDDVALQAQSAFASREQLERAYELCPTDHRIPAWLGPILVRMGRILGDDAMVEEGLDVLDQGIAAYPEFVLFSKLLVYADEPASSPEFSMALAAVDENTDACTAASGDPACGNTAVVPHNLEGAGVFLGDVYAKAGRRDDALAAYTMTAESADFATWNYPDLIEDRIATLDARIAAFATADPADDPESIWQTSYQCSLCHAD